MRHASGRASQSLPVQPLGVGLFALHRKAAIPAEFHFKVNLDSKEPYLDDHRPNGVPFFGTVMGLEALAGAVLRISPGLVVARIEDVRVESPCPVAEGSHRVVDIQVARSRLSSANAFDCRLDSRRVEPNATHFAARIVLAITLSPSARPPRAVVTGPESAAVPGSIIYRYFFHGPCFQVVHSAAWRDGTMLCRLNPDLPKSHSGPRRTAAIAPRLIELGLQCAGLFELAVSGRMRIPHRIGVIQRHFGVDVDCSGPLYALARRHAGTNAIDIDVVDPTGLSVLTIESYETVSLAGAESGGTPPLRGSPALEGLRTALAAGG